jgi:Family of unknown function (DUF6502)
MRARLKPLSQDPIKESTIIALKRIVDPLIGLMLDAGVTVQEFSKLVRESAVRSAADRVTRDGGRPSKSRVAIITGLSRSEVARILRLRDTPSATRPGQHPARKVLAAWYDTQQYLSKNGDPAILPIFGFRRSFEQLVAKHSGGIPVRAMLDQLSQINAVEILSGQRVRARSRVPIFTGLTTNAIAALGERAGDLLETLRVNLRATNKPFFEATALMTDVALDAVPLVRRELAEQGSAFIEGANSLLARSNAKPSRTNSKRSSKCRVGVTVYYFQNEPQGKKKVTPCNGMRRKNLQRYGGRLKAAQRSKLQRGSHSKDGHD